METINNSVGTRSYNPFKMPVHLGLPTLFLAEQEDKMNQKYFTEEEKKIGDRERSARYRRKKGILPRKLYTPEEKKLAIKRSQKKYHKKYYQKNKNEIQKRTKTNTNIKLKTDTNFK